MNRPATGRPPWWYVALASVPIPVACAATLFAGPLMLPRPFGHLSLLAGAATAIGSVVLLFRLGRSHGVAGGWVAGAIVPAGILTVAGAVIALIAALTVACSPDGC